MVTLKQAMAADIAGAFMNTSEFAESASYISPAGVTTTGVKVIVALQSFIQEFSNIAGLGATIVIARSSLANAEIHGKIVVAAGTFVINQIISRDDDTFMVAALGDTRISPAAMR